ncbi:MAG: kelch repeat-containing protein [Anaerolineales bacterium]
MPPLFRTISASFLLIGLLLSAGYSHAAEDLTPSTTNSLDGSWQLIVTSVTPPARYTHGMAYDLARDRVVMFGGDDKGKNHLKDTWEFNGNEWTQVSPANAPIGRVNISQAMVYDTQREKTVLFGGKASFGRLDDTWEYNGTDWVEITVPNPPPGRDGHALAYDEDRNLTVMFGGYNHTNFSMNDTWEYDGSVWTQVQPVQSPPGRNHHSIAYDSRRGVIVLFGGNSESGVYLDDTWEYDGTTWRLVTTLESPLARKDHSLAYDESRGVIVLFGGFGGTSDDDGQPLDDTWEYDGNTWYQVGTTLKPEARLGFPLVYDSIRERIILFSGGYFKGKLNAYEDTWFYSGGGGFEITHKIFIPLVE